MTRIVSHRQPSASAIVTRSGHNTNPETPADLRLRRARESTQPLPRPPLPDGWQTLAVCVIRQAPIELFFPARGGGSYIAEKIGEYCTPCPVRHECLAIAPDNENGWYGGLSPRQRRTRGKAPR